MPDRLLDLLLRLDVERVGLEEGCLALALEARGLLHRLQLVQEFAEPGRVVLGGVGKIRVRLRVFHPEHQLQSGKGPQLTSELFLTLRSSPIRRGSPITCRRIVSASWSTFLLEEACGSVPGSEPVTGAVRAATNLPATGALAFGSVLFCRRRSISFACTPHNWMG